MREAMAYTLRDQEVPVNLKDWHPEGKEVMTVRHSLSSGLLWLWIGLSG